MYQRRLLPGAVSANGLSSFFSSRSRSVTSVFISSPQRWCGTLACSPFTVKEKANLTSRCRLSSHGHLLTATTMMSSSTICSGGSGCGMFRTTLPRLAPADVPPALAKEIEEIISHARIVAFLTGSATSPRCRFTVQLVELLEQLQVPYSYFNILDDDEICQGLKKYSDWPTYPQVYVDGELLGGYDVVKEMMLSGALTKLLKEKKLLP